VLPWPKNFKTIPEQEWVRAPLESLALKYDTVENHGWYRNLDNTVDQISRDIKRGDILLDYSGGTGILANRLLRNLGKSSDLGILIVDSSPKFLRLAIEKLKSDPRVAYRLINFKKEEKRLEYLHEVIEEDFYKKGIDIISSTNAIHLYYNLKETLESWKKILRPGGRIYIQSGNINNPEAAKEGWIIDESVLKINEAVLEIVSTDKRFSKYRLSLEDKNYMNAHDKLREKYFLPVRSIHFYKDIFKEVGLKEVSSEYHPIEATVNDWYEFINVYHEGVIGWVGGSKKVTGKNCDQKCIEDRLTLIREGMEKTFSNKDTFKAVWNYFILEK
tara:strand:+ start:53 stop:1045 length:993 start_codon:yes stop_codon:yes gene_type:complete